VRGELAQHFTLLSSRVVERVPSEGGFKLVVQLQDGHRVETVVIRHHHETSSRTRHTVCVSSQVGCAKQCSFCATGTMGLRADLSAGEIAEQVWHADQALAAAGVLAPPPSQPCTRMFDTSPSSLPFLSPRPGRFLPCGARARTVRGRRSGAARAGAGGAGAERGVYGHGRAAC